MVPVKPLHTRPTRTPRKTRPCVRSDSPLNQELVGAWALRHKMCERGSIPTSASQPEGMQYPARCKTAALPRSRAADRRAAHRDTTKPTASGPSPGARATYARARRCNKSGTESCQRPPHLNNRRYQPGAMEARGVLHIEVPHMGTAPSKPRFRGA